MVNYNALKELVADESRCAKRKNEWTFLKLDNEIAIKYHDRFLVLHNSKVSSTPTIFEQVADDYGIDVAQVLEITGIVKKGC